MSLLGLQGLGWPLTEKRSYSVENKHPKEKTLAWLGLVLGRRKGVPLLASLGLARGLGGLLKLIRIQLGCRLSCLYKLGLLCREKFSHMNLWLWCTSIYLYELLLTT